MGFLILIQTRFTTKIPMYQMFYSFDKFKNVSIYSYVIQNATSFPTIPTDRNRNSAKLSLTKFNLNQREETNVSNKS